MKKLCVVGGMGPLATADFYGRLILASPAEKDQDHIETLIISDSQMPDRSRAIEENNPESLLQRFQKDLSFAESWGADYIAIPCNTSHYFMDAFQQMTTVPILDMVDLTAEKVEREVYVFATTGTYRSGVYQQRLAQRNKLQLPLTEEEKQISMDTIYAIKGGREPKLKNFPEFERILKEKLKEEKWVILACTELSLLDINHPRVVDAMDVLVERAIEVCYEKR